LSDSYEILPGASAQSTKRTTTTWAKKLPGILDIMPRHDMMPS
jgi:hypothetical protein